MKLNEAKQILEENGFIIEGSMNLDDKIINAKKFNISDDLKDAYKAILALVKTSKWSIDPEEKDNYFNLDDFSNGTIEKVMKINKGFYTLILQVERPLNEYNDFVLIKLCLAPSGSPVIIVSVGAAQKDKKFDVTEYKQAIKYANMV